MCDCENKKQSKGPKKLQSMVLKNQGPKPPLKYKAKKPKKPKKLEGGAPTRRGTKTDKPAESDNWRPLSPAEKDLFEGTYNNLKAGNFQISSKGGPNKTNGLRAIRNLENQSMPPAELFKLNMKSANPEDFATTDEEDSDEEQEAKRESNVKAVLQERFSGKKPEKETSERSTPQPGSNFAKAAAALSKSFRPPGAPNPPAVSATIPEPQGARSLSATTTPRPTEQDQIDYLQSLRDEIGSTLRQLEEAKERLSIPDMESELEKAIGEVKEIIRQIQAQEFDSLEAIEKGRDQILQNADNVLQVLGELPSTSIPGLPDNEGNPAGGTDALNLRQAQNDEGPETTPDSKVITREEQNQAPDNNLVAEYQRLLKRAQSLGSYELVSSSAKGSFAPSRLDKLNESIKIKTKSLIKKIKDNIEEGSAERSAYEKVEREVIDLEQMTGIKTKLDFSQENLADAAAEEEKKKEQLIKLAKETLSVLEPIDQRDVRFIAETGKSLEYYYNDIKQTIILAQNSSSAEEIKGIDDMIEILPLLRQRVLENDSYKNSVREEDIVSNPRIAALRNVIHTSKPFSNETEMENFQKLFDGEDFKGINATPESNKLPPRLTSDSLYKTPAGTLQGETTGASEGEITPDDTQGTQVTEEESTPGDGDDDTDTDSEGQNDKKNEPQSVAEKTGPTARFFNLENRTSNETKTSELGPKIPIKDDSSTEQKEAKQKLLQQEEKKITTPGIGSAEFAARKRRIQEAKEEEAERQRRQAAERRERKGTGSNGGTPSGAPAPRVGRNFQVPSARVGPPAATTWSGMTSRMNQGQFLDYLEGIDPNAMSNVFQGTTRLSMRRALLQKYINDVSDYNNRLALGLSDAPEVLLVTPQYTVPENHQLVDRGAPVFSNPYLERKKYYGGVKYAPGFLRDHYLTIKDPMIDAGKAKFNAMDNPRQKKKKSTRMT